MSHLMSEYRVLTSLAYMDHRSVVSTPIFGVCVCVCGTVAGIPERRLVMVEGSCRYAGLCVVTPISMEPAHLSTILSMRTWKTSLERSGRLLSTTPWLKSSVALGDGEG